MAEFQNTPVSQRTHIGFFGCTNAGKSALINAIANQEVSIVSHIKGTTTDPVKKTMELLPLGPVVLYDTAGLDDLSDLGQKRIQKTLDILDKIDIAILVIDGKKGICEFDKDIMEKFRAKKIPHFVVYNKADLEEAGGFCVSAETKYNIEKFKDKIAQFALSNKKENFIIKDKISKGDTVILVIPIDSAAPKGRIILPQQNTLREILDTNAAAICLQPKELKATLDNLKTPPKLVITDSQAFKEVSQIVPQGVLLTSFSILMARYKGNLKQQIEGLSAIQGLKNRDFILISEGCTHHRQCDDIGSVKIPKALQNYTNKTFNFEFSSGGEFPKSIDKYKLIIHCGACMLGESEMKSRLDYAKDKNIPIVNYGILLAYLNGILERTIEIFPEIKI